MIDTIQVEEIYESQEMKDLMELEQLRKYLEPTWKNVQKDLQQAIKYLETTPSEFNPEFELLADTFLALSYRLGVDALVEVNQKAYEVLNVELNGIHYGVTYRRI